MVRRSRREKTLTDYDEEIEAAKAKIEQAKAAKICTCRHIEI